MNHPKLSIAAVVIVLAVIGMDAQAKGGAGAGRAGKAGTVSGWTGSGLPGGSTGGSGGTHGYSVMSGYSVAYSNSLAPASNGLQLNPNGTISHVGMMAGSMSSASGTSLIGQSSVNTGLGIGNSQVDARMVGVGNSQVNIWTMGIGNSQISLNSQLAASGKIQASASNAGMPAMASNIMGYMSSALSSITTPQTGASKMGMPNNKACAGSGGSGQSCH